MSAGGMSYKGVIGFKQPVTLPSVSMWGANMDGSILKDPPRSIHTRRINKVGETSSITQMIEDSGDRACEAISVYARGVNPMVSVSYSNYGNNGGQGVNGTSRAFNVGQQAKLPYRIMDGGAFRPPVQRPTDLLPLSRLPRGNTTAFSKPGWVDYTKKAMCPGTAAETKEVNTSILQGCVRPTATYKIAKPHERPYDVKYVIQNPIHVSGESGMRSRDITQNHVDEPTKEVSSNPLHAHARVNKRSSTTVNNVESCDMDTERYTQKTLHSNVKSNKYDSKHHTPIGDVMDLDIQTKTPLHFSRHAAKSGNDKINYIHEDIELKRALPSHTTRTNVGRNIYKNPVDQKVREYSRTRPVTHVVSNMGTRGRQSVHDLNSREYRLKPTVNAGGYEGRGMKPMENRMQNVNEDYQSEKMDFNRKVYNQQAERTMY